MKAASLTEALGGTLGLEAAKLCKEHVWNLAHAALRRCHFKQRPVCSALICCSTGIVCKAGELHQHMRGASCKPTSYTPGGIPLPADTPPATLCGSCIMCPVACKVMVLKGVDVSADVDGNAAAVAGAAADVIADEDCPVMLPFGARAATPLGLVPPSTASM